jgi:hypothetical protein
MRKRINQRFMIVRKRRRKLKTLKSPRNLTTLKKKTKRKNSPKNPKRKLSQRPSGPGNSSTTLKPFGCDLKTKSKRRSTQNSTNKLPRTTRTP